MTQTDDIKMVVTHDRQERQPITLSRIYKSPPKIFQRKPLSQPGF